MIAVSATLNEKDRQMYMDAGFDAWLLKPINFARLAQLMLGIIDRKVRTECLYKPGRWDAGGWFEDVQPDVYAALTSPDTRQPFSSDADMIAAKQAESQNEVRGVETKQEEAVKEVNESLGLQ